MGSRSRSGRALGALLLASLWGCAADGDDSARLAAFCPGELHPELAELSRLVPQPQQVFRWGGQLTTDDPDWGAVVEHPAADWPELVATCGLEVPEVAGAYYLRAAGPDDVHLFAADVEGIGYGRQTLAQLVESNGLRPATVLDWPAVPLRGVLEGFYGASWDDADRLALLPELAALKLNMYLYAPKNDYSINLGWMVPFDEEQIARIQEVVAVASAHGIRVCWELHAGFPVTFSDETHFAAFRDKFHVIAAQGVDCLVLAFDDVGKGLTPDDIGVVPDFTTGLIEFANRLAADLHAAYPDALLGFVPVEYWTEHEDATTDLARQGAELDPAWTLAWTGPQIVSPTITAADVDTINGLLGRVPLLGDNYPVSDTVSRSGAIHLAPLVGRDPEAASGTGGLVFNAMPLAWASLPGIASSADFAWNAEGYDPARSLESVARHYAGSADEAFAAFCQANSSELLHGAVAPELDAALAAFWSAWDGGTTSSIERAATRLVNDHLGPYAWLPGECDEGYIHAGIAAEIRPWVDKLARYGAAGQAALELLERQADGKWVDPQAVADLAAEAAAIAELGPRPTGESMDTFLERAIGELSE